MPNEITSRFLDQNGLRTVVSKFKDIIEDNLKIVALDEIGELPNNGSINTIYIVQGEKGDVLYRWVPDKLCYSVIGTNYQNIEVIRGGNACV